MALSTVTVTFDLAQILGTDYDPRRTKVRVYTNVANQTLIDTAANKIRMGDETVTLASDGTGSFTTWAPGPDGNPTTWQTYVAVAYPQAGLNLRKTRVFGPYTITANADLADLEEEQAVPPEYLTTVTTLLDARVIEAEGFRDEAEGFATDVEANINGLDVGTVTTAPPGTPADVVLSGTAPDRTFDFTIPTGPQGLPGPGSAAWQATTAVTTGAIRQAPDGSYIKSTTDRTTRASFDATEEGFWTSVGADPTTFDGKALSASTAETIAADADAPTGIITKRGGRTKTDGQNVKNLRRPTLVIDAQFPNARNDPTILWVDESIGRLYALTKDQSLRRQTWTPGAANIDYGGNLGGNRSAPAAGYEWAQHGCFHRTASGALLMEEYVRGTGVTRLIRSTSASDGIAWTEVLALRGDVVPLGPQSIAEDPVTGYLYFAEYSSGTSLTDIRIYRSTDDGVTWTNWASRSKSAGGAGTFRHFHSARWDPISQRIYFCAGDMNDIAGLYRVNAGGTDIEPVIMNSQISAQFGLTAPARCVDVMFFPTHIVWASDGSGGQNYVFRMARTQIGQPSPVVERVAAVDNTAWYNQKASDDGSMWVCSASSEISGAPSNADNAVAHLYVISDNGAKVDDVAAVSLDPIYGAGSLSAVAGPSGGDAFWLRSHGHALPPFTSSTSGFQFRARIGNGVVPLIRPANARPLDYGRQGRNWVGDLTASQTKTFAHTRAGRARLLRIIDAGTKVLTGTANTAKVQVYNVTTSTLIYELATHQSYRSGFVADTSENPLEFLVGGSDQIEFRVVETAGNPITVSVFVEFAWAMRTIND